MHLATYFKDFKIKWIVSKLLVQRKKITTIIEAI